MPRTARLIAAFLVVLLPFAACADEGYYPIKADDGTTIANHRVPVELASQIEKLPGIIVLGNPHGEVTLTEFYDLNCPFCRAGSVEIEKLLKTVKELKLVLVPYAVLGIPSIQAGKVEQAVIRLAPPKTAYAFYRKAMASRGVLDGKRAIA
ncbi:MAG TPA: thioredoxin domain-containing protein, partial [Pseudolabrys sp.]|nr:thioredoxin domain-containing protein [Pseudolabrys sp.]